MWCVESTFCACFQMWSQKFVVCKSSWFSVLKWPGEGAWCPSFSVHWLHMDLDKWTLLISSLLYAKDIFVLGLLSHSNRWCDVVNNALEVLVKGDSIQIIRPTCHLLIFFLDFFVSFVLFVLNLIYSATYVQLISDKEYHPHDVTQGQIRVFSHRCFVPL